MPRFIEILVTFLHRFFDDFRLKIKGKMIPKSVILGAIFSMSILFLSEAIFCFFVYRWWSCQEVILVAEHCVFSIGLAFALLQEGSQSDCQELQKMS